MQCILYYSGGEGKPIPFSLPWENSQYTRMVMPEGYTESPPYFSPILKADLADVHFSNGSTLTQYVDDLFWGL